MELIMEKGKGFKTEASQKALERFKNRDRLIARKIEVLKRKRENEAELKEYKWLLKNWKRIGNILNACSESEYGKSAREGTEESMNEIIEMIDDYNKELKEIHEELFGGYIEYFE